MSMDAATGCDARLIVPDAVQTSRLVGESRRLFARTLQTWAVDVLRLRKRGLQGLNWDESGASLRSIMANSSRTSPRRKAA